MKCRTLSKLLFSLQLRKGQALKLVPNKTLPRTVQPFLEEPGQCWSSDILTNEAKCAGNSAGMVAQQSMQGILLRKCRRRNHCSIFQGSLAADIEACAKVM